MRPRRDSESLRAAFCLSYRLYHFSGQRAQLRGLTAAELARVSRIKVWLGLPARGQQRALRMIADAWRLARGARDGGAHCSLEAMTQGRASRHSAIPVDLRSRIGTPGHGRLLKRAESGSADAVEQSGTAFVSKAMIAGKLAARMQ